MTHLLPRVVLYVQPIKAEQGLKLGLVDELVAPEQLLAKAKVYALDMACGRRPRMLSLLRTDKLEPLGEALNMIEFARWVWGKGAAPGL